jgi:hypothetical protein
MSCTPCQADLVDAALARGSEDHDVRPVVGIALRDLFGELVAVQAASSVEQDEVVRVPALQLVESRRAVFRELDVELHPPQHCLQQHANGEVIVDDQNPFSLPSSFARHRADTALHRPTLRKPCRPEASPV